MKLFSASITLLFAILISIVAAYFSVVGLAALFAATFIPVVIMGSTLEAAKLVAAQWLHSNWKNPNVNFLHKTYMTSAVGALMLITSIGIYGFLSKGHLEQEAPLAGIELEVKQREQKIEMLQANNASLQTKLTQLDKSIDAFLVNDKASQGLKARNRQKAERDTIDKQLNVNNEQISKLNSEILPLKMQSSEVHAKLGPIKYVAELFGWEDANSAVRLVIMILMFAFDPLAIVMLLSAQITFNEISKERAARKEKESFKEEDLPVDPPVVTPFTETAQERNGDVSSDIQVMPEVIAEPQPVLNIENEAEHDEVKIEEVVVTEEPVVEVDPEPVVEVIPEPALEELTADEVIIEPKKQAKYRRALKKFVRDAYLTPAVVPVAEVPQAEAVPEVVATDPTSKEKNQLIELLEQQPELLNVVIEVITEYKKAADEATTIPTTDVLKTDQVSTEPRKSWLPAPTKKD
jgi:hypothetical protein